jgi:hypothetical protein
MKFHASVAFGLKSGQFDPKRDFYFAEHIKKRISNHEYRFYRHAKLSAFLRLKAALIFSSSHLLNFNFSHFRIPTSHFETPSHLLNFSASFFPTFSPS